MKVYEIVFSPTGGTQKVAEALGATLPAERLQVDLLDRKLDFDHISLEGMALPSLRCPPMGAGCRRWLCSG